MVLSSSPCAPSGLESEERTRRFAEAARLNLRNSHATRRRCLVALQKASAAMETYTPNKYNPDLPAYQQEVALLKQLIDLLKSPSNFKRESEEFRAAAREYGVMA